MLIVSDGATGDDVLSELGAAQQHSRNAAVTILALASDWADLHPALDEESAAYVYDRCSDVRLLIAGDGTPDVDALAVPEFAAVLELSTAAGLDLVGDALELRHRLPSLWRATMAGRVPAWHARRVAQCTRWLSVEAAAFVDRQVMVAGRIGFGRLSKLVTAAIAAYMPDQAEAERQVAAEHRRFDIDLRPGVEGLVPVNGWIDAADALDLDAAVTDGAVRLGQDGCTESMNVRRSMAIGDLARGQDTLDYTDTDTDTDTDSDDDRPTKRRPRGRQVVIYAHLDAAAFTGTTGVARLQNLDVPVLTGQVRDWCARPDTKITVKPVIDLKETISVDQYEIPDRVAEHIRLRDQRCVFPWCSNPHGDADHITPYAHDGPTSTDNLALLCRRHHRAKTHSRWSYRMLRPGLYVWTSPHGHRWLTDAHGTHRLD